MCRESCGKVVFTNGQAAALTLNPTDPCRTQAKGEDNTITLGNIQKGLKSPPIHGNWLKAFIFHLFIYICFFFKLLSATRDAVLRVD